MIKIVLHCLPNELDQVGWIVDQLKRSSRFINPKKFILDFTLNVSNDDVNWDKSILNKQFCIDKFNLLFEKSPFINHNKISYQKTGCNTVRRNALREQDDVTYIIGLDPDLFFPDCLLYYLYNASQNIDNKYSIVTPQIFQLWDESWDVISHKNYRNTPRDQKLWLGDPYKLFEHEITEVNLKPIPFVKFDGGWFTMYSKSLLQLVDIPDSLGHYGLDDTFVATCSNILMQKGYDIKHYVIEDVVVMEDRIYRSNSMDPFITLVDHKDDMRDKSHINYNNEIEKFKNRV
jgi:hypothetical protein